MSCFLINMLVSFMFLDEPANHSAVQQRAFDFGELFIAVSF